MVHMYLYLGTMKICTYVRMFALGLKQNNTQIYVIIIRLLKYAANYSFSSKVACTGQN